MLSIKSFNIIAESLGPFRFIGHVDPFVSLRSEIYVRHDSIYTLINQSSELLKSTAFWEVTPCSLAEFSS